MSHEMFTVKQRAVLHKRLARAICWKQSPSGYRDDANAMATTVLDEIEQAGFTAGTQRRAVEKIVASLDEATPVSPISPAEREVQAAPSDGAEVSTGVVS